MVDLKKKTTHIIVNGLVCQQVRLQIINLSFDVGNKIQSYKTGKTLKLSEKDIIMGCYDQH